MIVIRTEELKQQGLFAVWVVLREGAGILTDQGLMHGVMTADALEKLEEGFKRAVIERKPVFDGQFSDEPRPETMKMKQDSLFKEPS